MIFNFDFVRVSSIAGLKEWGEFKDADKMVQKLEELRKNEELHATDHGVLMTGYMQSKLGEVKKPGVFRLAYYAYIINQKSSQITLEIPEFPK